MSTALAERPTTPSSAAIEKVLIGGDLSQLNADQRVSYYNRVCESLGLNPLTKPFAYLKLSGKETLYALRDAAEQLRKIHGVSITAIETQKFDDVYVVTAKACDRTGRTDASTGAVPLGSLKGEALANALMKAETKAKRRVTLSICGLGMLDETEVESIPGAKTQGYTVTAPPVIQRDVLVAGNEHDKDGDPVYADVEVPADEIELPQGAVKVISVECKPTKNANITKYLVVLSDGREVSTIKGMLGVLAEAVCQEGVPVTVETKTSKWGEDLLAIHRLDKAEKRCSICGRLAAECVCEEPVF